MDWNSHQNIIGAISTTMALLAQHRWFLSAIFEKKIHIQNITDLTSSNESSRNKLDLKLKIWSFRKKIVWGPKTQKCRWAEVQEIIKNHEISVFYQNIAIVKKYMLRHFSKLLYILDESSLPGIILTFVTHFFFNFLS